jgi:hypothetical protein
MNLRHLVPFVLGLFLLLAGCSPTKPDNLGVTNDGTAVTGTGTITYYSVESGFWVIKGDDKVSYDPINLDKSYRIEGLRVRFRALLRNDMVSSHMSGPLVEIISISRL